MASNTHQNLLTDLLAAVSRSFYLTLRVLPASVRPQIGLAYLLARTTDTIADTAVLPRERRLQALHDLRDRILGQSRAPLQFAEFAAAQEVSAERTLLDRCEESLSLLTQFSPPDQDRIREVLRVITSGQELDLQRFSVASETRIVALQTETELDDYTYRVAGCVGEFWTRICLAHIYPSGSVDEPFLIRNGIRFGQGLQLVNILRDLPADLRIGRCYFPAELLTTRGITPMDLRDPKVEPRFRPIFESQLRKAEDHLRAGWEYTNALPRTPARIRLACAWPILIGIETIRLLRAAPCLDPGNRVKVSRSGVRRILLRSVALYPWVSRWRRLVLPASDSSSAPC